MKIGLFTDTYYPASNGIVLVVDMTRRQLEALGHEVYVFAPDGGVFANKLPDDPHVIRFPAIQYDMQLSLMFPPKLMRQIKNLHLDIIHFFTPAQVGLMSIVAARRTGAVLVGQHSTDTYEFSKNYRAMTVSSALIGLLLPFILKLNERQAKNLVGLYVSPHRENDEKWAQKMMAGLTSMIYASCDGVIAVSNKSAEQLRDFAKRNDEKLNLTVIPNGVDLLPPAKADDVRDFRAKFNIAPDDEIVVNFGRIAEEKNLKLLVDMMPELLKRRPHAKLLFAGDYIYRKKLESIAAKSLSTDRIIFSGRYDRKDLNIICATSRVFAFPSITDTQALVLNEAAGAGLPIVMCDQNLNDVFEDKQNGLFAKNEAKDFAEKIATILGDENLRARFGENSKKLAENFSEKSQAQKLLAFYETLLREKK